MSTYVQDTFHSVNASANPVVFAGNVTAGNVIGGGVRWGTTTRTLNSVTQTGTATVSGITMVNNPTADATNAAAAMWYAVVTGTGSCTITFNFSAGTNSTGYVFEASGCNTTTPFRGSAMQAQDPAPGTGTDALNSGSIGVTTTLGDFVWGFFVDTSANAATFTKGSFFTLALSSVANDSFTEYGNALTQNNATGTWSSAAAKAISGCLALRVASGASVIIPTALLHESGRYV